MADSNLKKSPPDRRISMVIPLLNESASLEELHADLSSVLPSLASRYEIIFIDDGSTDGSIDVLKSLRARDGCVKYIRFRRNFGKSAALAAGFSAARYEIIVTMDADLQDLPDQLPLLMGKLEEGNDLVSGWRHSRRDRLTKRAASRVYNKVTSILTGVRLHDINCGFKCYRKEVLDEVMIYGERHRYIPVLASYRGFRLAEVKINHAPRAHGSSRYGLGRVSGGFFSLLTVILLTRYTNKPLHFFGVMGMALAGVGTLIDSYLIFMRAFYKEWLSNRPLLIIGTLLIIVGLQLVLFGLLAEMIAFSYRRENDYSIVETSEDEGVNAGAARGMGADARAQEIMKEKSGR
ncbi:MAG TPA: glycosyltransferase family 2 protein [Blastocatellia bacterium]|nr:glycosyltransferase family 2 protein [Blastocatellia bacterium]